MCRVRRGASVQCGFAWAASTLGVIEADEAARWDVRDLAGGACDDALVDAYLEVRLAEDAGLGAARRARVKLDAVAPQRCNLRTRQVAAVQVYRDDSTVAVSCIEEAWCGLVLPPIRRLDRGAEDDTVRDDDVALVASDRLRFALSAVPHLRVTDGDHALLGDAIANATAATVGVRLEVLLDDASH